MHHQTLSTQKLVTTAMIAAVYAAVSICLLPLAFSNVQVRVAEALTLVAVFGPTGIWGVTLGCALTNLIGIFTGANLIGVLDLFFGTGATLLAAWMSYGLRNLRFHGLPVASSIPPVLVNAIVIGGELTWLAGGWNPAIFFLSAAQVAIGQLLSCCVLGLGLIALLQRSHLDHRLFGALQQS